jgi:glycosyltransferase 2 family protein
VRSSYVFVVLEKITLIKRYTKTDKLKKIQTALNLVLSNKKTLVFSLLLSLIFFVSAIFNTMWAGNAVGWSNPSFLDVGSVLPLILIIGALPITPSGIGVQEGVFYFFLHSIGATQSQALAVAVVLRIKWLILSLLGGLVWLFELIKKKD